MAVTPETLLNRVSRIRRSGKEYSAALDRFTHNLGELGLEREDVPSRSWLALGLRLLDRGHEEVKAVVQAEAHLERLGRLEIGVDDNGGEGIEAELGPPPSTAGGAGPTPVWPGGGLPEPIATNRSLPSALPNREDQSTPQNSSAP